MPHIQTRTCGSPGPINVSRFLRVLVPLSGYGIQHVANRSFIPVSTTALIPSSAVRSELIDWGTATVARQASQAAEQLLPGVSIVHHACQAYHALTAAQQGDMLTALRQIPLGAVLPAFILEHVRNLLQNTCARSLRSVPDHDPVVLLLAAGALLCHLKATPDESQTHATQTAALRLLRCARTTLEGMRGLRGILAVQNPASLESALPAGATQRPEPTATRALTNATWQECNGVETIHLPARGESSLYEDSPGSAWPLPSALATPGKKHGAANPPVKAGQNAQGNVKGGTGTHLQRSYAIRRKGTSPDDRRTSIRGGAALQPRGNAASRSPAAMAGHADSAKESMQSPLKHAPAGKIAGWERRPSEPQGKDTDVHEKTLAGQTASSLAALNGSVSSFAGTHASLQNTGINSAPPLNECIEFDDIRVLSLLVRSRRYQPSLMHVCVRPEDSPLFKEWVTLPANSHRGMGLWMVSEAIHDHVPQTLSAAPVRRLGARGEMELEGTPTLSSVGTDRVFTLLTMSLLDEPLRREAGGWELLRMQANSFRVLQYTGLDGLQHHYLAYFLHRESGDDGGVRGGFLEIWSDAGGMLGVEDQVHDISITATTLENLVLALQKLTGLNYIGAPGGATSRVTAGAAGNLFVDDDQILSTRSPQRHLPFNDTLHLFAPVMVEVPGRADPVPLYHNSFMLLDNVLAYADETEQGGLLYFGLHTVGGGARQLRCLTPPDCVFAARHGLLQGVFYTAERVVQTLSQRGLVSLWHPEADDMPVRENIPLPSAAPASSTESTTAYSWPALLPARSTFTFRDGALHYVGDDGRKGMLAFEPVLQAHGTGYQLSRSLNYNQQAFAARNGFGPGIIYSEDDIDWLLGGQGYVRMPNG